MNSIFTSQQIAQLGYAPAITQIKPNAGQKCFTHEECDLFLAEDAAVGHEASAFMPFQKATVTPSLTLAGALRWCVSQAIITGTKLSVSRYNGGDIHIVYYSGRPLTRIVAAFFTDDCVAFRVQQSARIQHKWTRLANTVDAEIVTDEGAYYNGREHGAD